MRKYYPSFLDKKTGLEIQSTPLAQLGSVFTQVLFVAALGFLGFRLTNRYGTDWMTDPINALAYKVRNELDFVLILTVATVVGGIVVGLIYVGVVSRVGNWVHDGIARWQHHCRQKRETE